MLFLRLDPFIKQRRRSSHPNSDKPLSDPKPRFLGFRDGYTHDGDDEVTKITKNVAQLKAILLDLSIMQMPQPNCNGEVFAVDILSISFLFKPCREDGVLWYQHPECICCRTILMFHHKVKELFVVDWRLDLKRTLEVVVAPVVDIFR